MGVFIEHCNARFPLYFSPYQVSLLPVGEDSHMEYCNELVREMRKQFRNELQVDVIPPDLYGLSICDN